MRIRRRKRSISVYIIFLIVGLFSLWYQTRSISKSSYIEFHEPDLQGHVCGNTSYKTDLSFLETVERTTVKIFIAIVSAPSRIQRRNAIRRTWASTVSNYSAVYKFFTDERELKPDIKRQLIRERILQSDLEFTPTRGGYWMSHRFLYALFWAFKRYKFKFFMRLDDDYFLCLNHLMDDLQYRGEKFLYWGWLRCRPRMVAMDEGFVIFSTELLREIMRRNNSLCCHPYGDQMMAMWLYRLEREGYDVKYFADNNRVLHQHNNSDLLKRDFCSTKLAIHQAYPTQMHEYWKLTSSTWLETKFEFVPRKGYQNYCIFPRGWDWRLLGPLYRHEPKPCWGDHVSWRALENYTIHVGREAESRIN